VFSGLDRSRLIVKSTALGWLRACLGVRSSIHKMEIDFIRETRAWIWRYSLWIWWCHPDCPNIYWTVSHLFFI